MMRAAAVTFIIPPLRRQLRSEARRSIASSVAQCGADCAAIVGHVAEARGQMLENLGGDRESQSSESCRGRLLLHAPEDDLACGVAGYSSLDFFDVDNVPPWETWIVMLGKYLVSWVPAQLVRLVQEGLDVNPEQCILWADGPSFSKEQIAATLDEFSAKVA
jgi:hypothetical protein